jgi:hypothetical protein
MSPIPNKAGCPVGWSRRHSRERERYAARNAAAGSMRAARRAGK